MYKWLIAVAVVLIGAVAAVAITQPFAPSEQTVSQIDLSDSDLDAEADDLASTRSSSTEFPASSLSTSLSIQGANSESAQNSTQSEELQQSSSSIQNATEDSTSTAGKGSVELGVDVYAFGREAWSSDAEYERLVALLGKNPALVSELFEQLRYETDPARLKRLSAMLGQFNHPQLAEIANEMVFSGNVESQKAALELLRQAQASDPAARDVLINALTAEADPSVLSLAMNAITKFSDADDQQRQTVMTNVTSLTQHEDPIIRARSYGILTNWADNADSTQVILQGLSDDDHRVRTKTAYSLANYDYVDADIKNGLLAVAENASENKQARQGALLALSKINLSSEDIARVSEAQSRVNGKKVP